MVAPKDLRKVVKTDWKLAELMDNKLVEKRVKLRAETMDWRKVEMLVH